MLDVSNWKHNRILKKEYIVRYQRQRSPHLVGHPGFFFLSLLRFSLHYDGGQNFSTGNEFRDLKRQRVKRAMGQSRDLVRPGHDERRRLIACKL